MSSGTELVIFLAVIAAGWIVYVVRQVLRDRKKPSLPVTADAFEGNLIIPAAGMRRHGLHGAHSGIGHGSSAAGHMGAHHGPGGFDVQGPFGGGHHH
jgi:hypothetical protein